jgi:hypothetical protein
MILQMYIGDKLVDSLALSLAKITDRNEREWYIQGAINELSEKWCDLIKDQNLQVEFFIKGQLPF